jgi:hypothetical protein
MQSEHRTQSGSWIFWASYAGIAAYALAAFFPSIHLPKGVDTFILFTLLAALLLFGPRNITTPQVIFSAVIGTIALGFGVYRMWNNPGVILIVPAFLFMLLFLVVLVRVRLRRRTLQLR